jgi:hypothetical protein
MMSLIISKSIEIFALTRPDILVQPLHFKQNRHGQYLDLQPWASATNLGVEDGLLRLNRIAKSFHRKTGSLKIVNVVNMGLKVFHEKSSRAEVCENGTERR